MAPVDTEYYDLLAVKPDVADADLKKAYRKQAIIHHPDKGGSAEKFQQISKAYQVLSDPNLRAAYDKNGKDPVAHVAAADDAAAFFASVFGGEAFVDIIGEISLMKEMTSAAEVYMTEEDKAAMAASGTSTPTPTPSTPTPDAGPAAPVPGTSAPTSPSGPSTPSSDMTPHTPGGSKISTGNGSTLGKDAKKPGGKNKLTPEQREKLKALDEERAKAMQARIDTLSAKLRDRIKPFVEAKNSNDKNDPEVLSFEKRMKKEAEELKYESFGVELLHTIGTVYIMKATSFLKSRKFLGIPGFWSRMKERGAMVKDVWGLIGSTIGVQTTMEDLTRLQEKGEIPEEELRALETDLTGKILLVSWRGTRFEVTQVLREVCDKVLKEPGVSEQVLLNRAKAILLLGAIYKATQPDESPEERRELEKLVAEAAAPKPKAKDKKKV